MSAIDKILSANNSAFYTFDAKVLKKRIAYLKSALPENVTLCYAAKANPFVLKEISKEIDVFELCSPGEYYIYDSLGLSADKTVISGVYKTPEFIEKLFADSTFNGVFTVESKLQYNLLCTLSRKYNKRIKILLRLTNSSQFGINESDVEEIISDLKNQTNLHCLGIQFFSGTQKTSIKKIRRELEKLDELLNRLKSDFGFTAQELEYGPGFPASYFVNDEFDEQTYLAEFSQALGEMTFKTNIILELGRSIVASCGKYYTHVVDVKINNGLGYVLVDGGMHHIVYFGQQMAMKHPILSVIGKPDTVSELKWTICGSLCSMNDIIAKQVELPNISVGDTICFENAGAYCVMEGISLFLSRDLPAVYILCENDSFECVRTPYETFELNLPKYNKQ